MFCFEMLEGTTHILIYGAHLVALECCRMICALGMAEKIIGFAVTDMRDNPKELEGYHVHPVADYVREAESCLLILAMPSKYHRDVRNYAQYLGFRHIQCVSLEEMSVIKGKMFIQAYGNLLPLTLQQSENDPTWLDIYLKGNKERCSCKFPTLLYLAPSNTVEYAYSFCDRHQAELNGIIPLHALSGGGFAADTDDNVIQIYMVFGEREIAFLERHTFPRWIVPLQVGDGQAASYSECRDTEGDDSITEKNPLFAEMTGAFWIWKYAPDSTYKGLCHYRRHFVLEKNDIRTISTNDVDVLLTVPRYVPGGIGRMFTEETPVKEPVLACAYRAIEEVSASDRGDFERYLDGDFYFPNNMVVAKRGIYDSYCAWIFPILLQMERIDRETGYGHERDRHIAYIAELLTSYYFIKHKDRWKTTVTDYRFYG